MMNLIIGNKKINLIKKTQKRAKKNDLVFWECENRHKNCIFKDD